MDYVKKNHLSIIALLLIVFLYISGGETKFGVANQQNLTTIGNQVSFTNTQSPGGVNISSTTAGTLAVTSTLGVTATSSFAGNLVIGSTTPMAASSTGFAIIQANSNATATAYLVSNNGTKGGCIQLEGPASSTFRLYATTTGPLQVESGTCQDR